MYGARFILLFGGLQSSAGTDPLAPGAPISIAAVTPLANPPSFLVGLRLGEGVPLSTAEGDIIQIGLASQTVDYESAALDAADIIAGEVTIANGTLSAAARTPYARVKRPGTPDRYSSWTAGSSYTVLEITSSATFSMAEGQTAAGTVTASAASTFAKTGGADTALFNLDTNTGALTFAVAPDFEVPGDAGGNNVYNVEVTATRISDSATSAEQAIAVTVTDVAENVVATFLGANSSGTDTATYDFAGVGLGDATNFVVGITARSAGTPAFSSVTLHVPNIATDPTGTAMSQIAALSTGGGNIAGIYRVARPSASTGDVRVVFGASALRCGIARYKMTAYSGSPVTGTSSASPPSSTLSVPANGAVIGVAISAAATTSSPTNLTEDHDGAVGAESATFTAGSSNSASGSTAFTFTFASHISPIGAFAAFGP